MALDRKINDLSAILQKTSGMDDEIKKPDIYCSDVLPAIESLRETVDRLEEETDDTFWTLPKYQEMLFIY